LPRGSEQRIRVMRAILKELDVLPKGEASFGHLQTRLAPLGSHVTLSKALKQLGRAGIIERTIDGTWRMTSWGTDIAWYVGVFPEFKPARNLSVSQILKELEHYLVEITLPPLAYSMDSIIQVATLKGGQKQKVDRQAAEETAALLEALAGDGMAESFSEIVRYFLGHPHSEELHKGLLSRVDLLFKERTK
jgi:DNA-binding transcriptional ArsR family regulator